MSVEISKNEAMFLLEAIAQKSVSFTVADVINGVNVDASVKDLIRKLQLITQDNMEDMNPEVAVEETAAEVVEAPEADAAVESAE